MPRVCKAPLALEDGGDDGPDSSPATPPDQVLAIADSSEPAEGAEYQATKAVTLRKKEQLQQAKKGKSKDKGKDKKPTDDAALEKEKPRKGLPPRLPQLGHAPTLPEPSVASAWRERADHQLEQRVNSGFQEPDEVSWARWIAEDEEQRQGDMLADMTATEEERAPFEHQQQQQVSKL